MYMKTKFGDRRIVWRGHESHHQGSGARGGALPSPPPPWSRAFSLVQWYCTEHAADSVHRGEVARSFCVLPRCCHLCVYTERKEALVDCHNYNLGA